ncbi:MAG: hypothetical protein IT449_18940 [Phycisphaerales bacterium]|nr:hypothetical protein [Phycisphaerales bacterium]
MKSNATFQTCTFDSNKAKLGGGMYAVGVPILDDCTFTNKDADDGHGDAARVFRRTDASVHRRLRRVALPRSGMPVGKLEVES